MSERAQVFTLEAVLAAFVVLAGLVFVLQAVAISPSGGGGSAAAVDANRPDGLLADATADGSLHRAVLYWDEGSGEFHNADPSGGEFSYYSTRYDSTVFETELKDHLNAAFGSTVAVNVVVRYQTPSGGTDSQRLLYNGPPGDGAVRSSTAVALYDDDPLYEPGGGGQATATSTTIKGGDFYADDVETGSDLFNVLEVEVVAWRT